MKTNLEMAHDLIACINAEERTKFISDSDILSLARCYVEIAQVEALEKIAKSLEETNSNIARMTLY